MSRLNVGNLFNENEDGAPVVSGISTFSSPNYFVPPSGSTAQRPSSPGEGMIRFNTDSGHLEYYTGTHWADVIVKETATNSGRAFFAGGYVESGTPTTNAIEYVTIQSTGNSVDFGDLTRGVSSGPAACSSSTRGIFAGGSTTNVIDFITFASIGDATDFGDLTRASLVPGACSDSTRGVIFISGSTAPAGYTNEIQFITMASTSDATDFGDLLAGNSAASAMSNGTRGVVHTGGQAPASGNNTLEYITIQSTGNSVDFGDLAQGGSDGKRVFTGAFSNSVRGIFYGGTGPGSPSTTEQTCIQYITISTTGNSLDFGDLTANRNQSAGACDATRGIMGGGNPGTARNSIEFVTISTLGNSQDFGDFSVSKHSYYQGGCSNAHGGL